MTSFFFYDLETSGVNPREARVMQFAGQRTDMELQPTGDPENILIRLSDDVLPDPDAIMITGITPQQTLQDGVSEAEFLQHFHEAIATPGTIFVGFNTVRFDDEFMRYMHYRSFYDPYEWQYIDRKSRWDLLDVVRMTRALRPEGITWPVDDEGRPTNRLELLTQANGIAHEAAHDALSDVTATIAVARLVKQHQPKLFDYLLSHRDKAAVAEVVESGNPFVYSSGKYDGAYEKTAVVSTVAKHPSRANAAIVYDLRVDPSLFTGMSVDELAEAWQRRRDDAQPRLPVKTLVYNRCPAVAPVGTVGAAWSRLGTSLDEVTRHRAVLAASDLPAKLLEVVAKLDAKQAYAAQPKTVDAQLYDGFFAGGDKQKLPSVRAGNYDVTFNDARLTQLLPLYKARNDREALTDADREVWEQHRNDYLLGGGASSRAAAFFNRLAELANSPDLSPEKQFLLEELQLYGQSVLPVAD